MSKRTDKDYVGDMMEASIRAIEYCGQKTYDEFLEDTMAQDAVIRNIEIMGEATKNISVAFKQKYPQVPWRHIAGMRDRLIHDYFGVNLDIVWDVVTNDLSDLIESLEPITENHGGSDKSSN